MKNESSNIRNEAARGLRHRKEGEYKESSVGLTIEEVEKDQPLPQQEDVGETSENCLSWLVGNLASTAKNAYTYFDNWLYGDSHEPKINQIRGTEPNFMQTYEKFPDYLELLKPGQLISNKVLEIRKKAEETNEYQGDNKEKYIQKLHDILNEPMPTTPKEKQDYLLKIIYVTLELEAIYGEAGKAAEEYIKDLDKEQKLKLSEAVSYETRIKNFEKFNFEIEFRDYLNRKGITKEELDQKTLNKYKVEMQKYETEITYEKYDRKMYEEEKLERLKKLYELWEYDEEEGTVEFKGNLQDLKEWKEFTEKISCIGEPTGELLHKY